jgi:hypothetical protein
MFRPRIPLLSRGSTFRYTGRVLHEIEEAEPPARENPTGFVRYHLEKQPGRDERQYPWLKYNTLPRSYGSKNKNGTIKKTSASRPEHGLLSSGAYKSIRYVLCCPIGLAPIFCIRYRSFLPGLVAEFPTVRIDEVAHNDGLFCSAENGLNTSLDSDPSAMTREAPGLMTTSLSEERVSSPMRPVTVATDDGKGSPTFDLSPVTANGRPSSAFEREKVVRSISTRFVSALSCLVRLILVVAILTVKTPGR